MEGSIARRALTTAAVVVATGFGAEPGVGQAPGILVSTEWVAEHAGDPAVVVLHVDSRKSAYEEGHLPGARFLDLNAISWPGDPAVGTELRTAADIDAALEAVGVRDGHRVVVYGANPLAAARAWMTLDVMGWGEHASFMDGGLGAWREEGKAVTTDEPSFDVGSVTLRPRSGVVVDSDWILQRLDDASVTLLDARPDGEYTGADGGMGGMAHAGHIPGAYQIYWEKFVQSRPVHRALPSEELKALFAPSGAADGSTVVAYCMVGLRASYAYMVTRILGYDAKFYDGSWHDWGTKDLPYVSGASRR
jgi:thiosulfate/3-mercaptopyruvate sulfurtransferase